MDRCDSLFDISVPTVEGLTADGAWKIITSQVGQGDVFGFGWCYLHCFDRVLEVALALGFSPRVKRVVLHPSADFDDEFGPWAMRLPDCDQLNCRWESAPHVRMTEINLGGVVTVIHASPASRPMDYDDWRLLSKYYNEDVVIGLGFDDLTKKITDLDPDAERFASLALQVTSDFEGDATENYLRIGDLLEQERRAGNPVASRIGRGVFSCIMKRIVHRWAGEREAGVASRLAACLLFDEEPWSPAIFEEAMDENEGEEEKQARLVRMAGLVFRRAVTAELRHRTVRALTPWRADPLAPARVFCRVVGTEAAEIQYAASCVAGQAAETLGWASSILAAQATDVVTVMAKVAAGSFVAATVFTAAGFLLDWYYDFKSERRLGPDRISTTWGFDNANFVNRAQNLFAVGMAMSDDVYDTTSHTNVIRVDPFFFGIKPGVARLSDRTASDRQVANALLAPLITTINTPNKTVILLPGSISEESAKHIQEAMPEFYFKIVSRNHSHPELWAIRRGFEMIVARALVASDTGTRVVMIGGNVRQTSKIPGVVANYGPILSGRDDFRHDMKGNAAQRNFFRAVNIPEKFGANPVNFGDSTGVSFYSAQDIWKEDYLKAAIACGIRKHYVALNIPVIMMDDRITEWEDTVLGCKYTRNRTLLSDDLLMTPLRVPVAGYRNDFGAVMSWVKPHKPILGYDCTVSALAQVGSSYLLEIDIGVGPQESYHTIWRMPDAGHYVLIDLTRDSDHPQYYTVPAQKFDTCVKYMVQLNGAKNGFEAMAGRIMGLEAQIKIGNSVLERAWYQQHRHFVSTAAHAMTCAGVSKSDALHMLGKLRDHFTEFSQRTWWSRALDGYKKLFGLDVDLRLPTKAHRGASDYDPVTHWTSHQPAGSGFAPPFRPALKDPDFVECGDCSDSDESIVGGGDHVNELDVEDLQDGNASDTSVEDEVPNFVERFGQWFRPTFRSDADERQDDFGGFRPDSGTLMLRVDVDEVTRYRTDSEFVPEGEPNFVRGGGSISYEDFKTRYASMQDVSAGLERNDEFPAPDQGAIGVLRAAYAREKRRSGVPGPLQRRRADVPAATELENLENTFHQEMDDSDDIVVPSLLMDGISGAAKSSVVRGFLREQHLSAAIVCPTRKLAKDWRKARVGTVVTKHRLMASTLRGRHVLVVDEVYAYTKEELFAYLKKASDANAKVILLGDRKQQYEDGNHIDSSDILFYGLPCMRFCVSNTMPVDALKIAAWAAEGDPFARMYQTRNKRVHSIFIKQKDDAVDRTRILVAVESPDCLVMKDRLGPRLDYETVTDEELGFKLGEEDQWMSVSRAQGSRTRHSLLLASRFSRAERWFADQKGLFYVATSRHSESMLYMADQYDLTLIQGLEFAHQVTVEGRLAVLQARERFDAPILSLTAFQPKESRTNATLLMRGAPPQVLKFKTAGAVVEDWRPWHRFSMGDSAVARKVFDSAVKNLVGEGVPYVQTDASKMPVYSEAMGLKSIRRPELWQNDVLSTAFEGLSRLAVPQHSRDELLDQKNVIERTARPRVVDRDPVRVAIQGNALFDKISQLFLVVPEGKSLSTEPSASDWADSRTPEFAGKLETSDHYGGTAYSTRSQGFLKTQIKVKLKRTFAMEENYGQTVLASPADFNAMFGPWSKMALRNLRLICRDGLFLDSGYSDRELARELRKIGAFQLFAEENHQADVEKQDTSHTPVTLRVFCLLMVHLGIPQELMDIYEKHSADFEYQSMHAGLYRGTADHNLGSGDPFTLIRNIVELLTVLVERYGDQLADVVMILKGDDYIGSKIPELLPVQVPEIRATNLKEEFNKPPYHAGRFFTSDDIIPDPVRMVAKFLVKASSDIKRVNQLAEAFYDRYIPLTSVSYAEMAKFVTLAYSDFEPELPLSALEMYHAMRDRTLFFDLMYLGDTIDEDKKLVTLSSETDCIAYAATLFGADSSVIRQLTHETVDVVEQILVRNNIPCHRVRGKPNDFLKRGIWLSEDHAWAVIGLTEFNILSNTDAADGK